MKVRMGGIYIFDIGGEECRKIMIVIEIAQHVSSAEAAASCPGNSYGNFLDGRQTVSGVVVEGRAR